MPAGVKRDPPSSLSLSETVRNWMASRSLLGVRGEYFYHLYLSNENAWSPRSFPNGEYIVCPKLYCFAAKSDRQRPFRSKGSSNTLLTGSHHFGESYFSGTEMLGHQQSLRLKCYCNTKNDVSTTGPRGANLVWTTQVR